MTLEIISGNDTALDTTLAPDHTEEAYNLVSNHLSEAMDYVHEIWYGSGSYNGLRSWLYYLQYASISSFEPDWSDLTFEFPEITTDYDDPTAPDEPTISVTLPEAPQQPTLSSFSLDTVDFPSFEVSAPTITIPDAPSVTTPTEPGEPPVLSDPEYPTKPDMTLPDVPTVDELTVPDPPDLSMPDWEGTYPEVTADAPGVTFVYNETEYSTQLAEALKTWLYEQHNAGGTGLGSDVEDDLWERARARNDTKNLELYDAVELEFENRGFPLPMGAMAGRLYEVQREISRSEEQINYEITIEQARLIYDNRHKIADQIVAFETQLMSYSNSVAQRAFESARYAQQAAIDVFNAEVAYYNMQLQAYQTAAAVYAEKIKANNLVLERHKALLESKRLHADIQAQYVEIYGKQIQAQELLIKAYATEMESARIKSEIEKARIQAFGEKVNAYIALVNGNTARYNAYQAQIAGETAKAAAYREQVQAYLGRVQAAEVESRINIAEAEMTLKENDQSLAEFKALIEKYNTEVDAEVKEADANARIYGYSVDRYRAAGEIANHKINAQVESYRAMREHERNQIQLMVEEARANLQASQAAEELQLKVSDLGAQSLSQAFGMALSAIGVNLSFGADVGLRQSISGDPDIHYDVGERYSFSADYGDL